MATFIPANIKRKLANPGERHKLSTATLDKYAPDLAAKRRANTKRATENATLYNPSALLSGEGLRTAVKGTVDAELNPQIAAANREAYDLGSSRDQLAKIVGAIYGQLQPAATAAVDTATTGATRLAQGLKDAGIAQSSAIEKARADTAGQIDPRGTGLDAGTSQRLALEFVEQKDRAAAQQYGAQSLADAQSQGFIGRAGMAAAVLPAQASGKVADVAGQFTKPISDALANRAALEANRGPLTAKTLTDLRQTEFEKAATAETLKLKSTETATDKAVKSGINPTTGEPLPPTPTEGDKTFQREQAKWAAKAGMTPHQWALLGPTKRAAKIKQLQKTGNTAADKVITTGPYIGLKPSELAGMSQKERVDYAKTHGKNAPGGKGPAFRTPNEVSKPLGTAKTALGQVKGGKLVSGDGKTSIDLKGMNRQHVADILISHGVDEALTSAILDAVPKYNKGGKPHLSKETQQRLIAAGFKPSQIARSLGIPTAGTYKKQVAKNPLINLPRAPTGRLVAP